jgi:hypothetical protein
MKGSKSTEQLIAFDLRQAETGTKVVESTLQEAVRLQRFDTASR